MPPSTSPSTPLPVPGRGRLLELQLGPEGPRRTAVEAALRSAIRDGRLPAGSPLPSTRALAADLGLARGTVVDAYERLRTEGLLRTRAGAATTVAAAQSGPNRPPSARRPAEPDILDLRPRYPDLSAFPRAQWSAAIRHVMRTASSEAFGNGDMQGRIELRAALAQMLGRSRGVIASPERIVICGGFTQGLSLIAQELADRGATHLGMENPNLEQHRRIVESRGLAVDGLPVDSAGASLAGVDAARLSGVVVTPSHQHPVGVALSPARRTELLAWAAATGGVIVEDDYDGEFRYDRQPPASLQSRAPDLVIYAGTASKTLAPGLRLGWLVAPPQWISPIVEQKRLADAGASSIDQLALAHLVSTGAYERQVRRMRLTYRRRRDHTVGRLAARLPQLRVSGLAAGLHVVVHLPSNAPSEAEALRRLARSGVVVGGLSASRHDPGRGPDALLVSYAAPPGHAFERSIERFVAALAAAIEVG
ncbi:MAG: transcriptional regulator, GntR family with aminotransferase domain [Pseudonocardiales bacterium]|nr:transcriptional regulator, GntR family with aminotransferase domain [Pseudonocardiales bacterium]